MADNCNIVKEKSSLPVEFQNGVRNKLTNASLQNFLKDLEPNSHEQDTKNAIKEIVNLYVTSKENKVLHIEARKIIIELFTRYNGKKHLKKYAHDLMYENDLTGSIIKETVLDILSKIKHEKTCDLKECNEFLHFVSVLQTGNKYDFDGNFRALFPLYISLFDSYAIYASQIKQDIIPEIEELNVLMNAVLKQILTIFVKKNSFIEEVTEQNLKSLLMYSYILLFNEKIGFDLRMKVALVFVNSSFVLEGETRSITHLLSKNESQFKMSINSNQEKPSDYFIIICSSIISVLSGEKLVTETVDGKLLICVLFDGILETSSGPGHSAIVIEASKALCLLAKQFKSLPIDIVKGMFLEGLCYISCFIDYFIDTVRNHIKNFFEELIAVAAYHHNNNRNDLTEIFLDKFIMVPEEYTMRLMAFENIVKHYGSKFLLEEFEGLPLILLTCIDNRNVDQVCKSYQVIMEKCFDNSTPENGTHWLNTWVMPVVKALRSGQKSENFCHKIVSAAFKCQPSILRMIFPNQYVGTVEEFKVLLHCLCNARKNGIELCLEKDSTLYWRGLIDKNKMEGFMIHQNEEIRLLVLAAVAESLKSTELFVDWEFIFLINYIRYNITTQSPSARKQIIGHYKNVLLRYDAGSKVVCRNIAKLTESLKDQSTAAFKDQKALLMVYQEVKRSYMKFICNITKIFIGNLSYDSNYPRRSTSLELLLIIQGILTPDEWRSCWDEEDIKNSHNILFDSFERNKKMVVKLLKTLPPAALGFTNATFTCKYMERSFDLVLDVKPSKTLSAAYLFDMCTYSPYFYEFVNCEFGEDTKKANDPRLYMILVLTQKFVQHSTGIVIDHISMAQSSVYGLILSIRHLLENRDIRQHNGTYSPVFKHLVETCFTVAEKIMPVVCNPSPEGYLPEHIEDLVENDESPNAQMVLVYCWRTMKEMTLLLAEIVRQSIRLERESGEMLPDDILTKIGEFFVKIFIQSRHRGVFEQAYVGFNTICELFWNSSRPKISSLPKKWLTETLELCTGKKHSDDLCATRRSAGLPFLILSLVVSPTDCQHFQHAITVLLDTAEGDCDVEVKMHCLNTLRAIYRHSKLGELVAVHVSRGMILAIKGFKSEAWGIRNSSTLLFSALMVRLFGVQRTADEDAVSIKNKLTVRVFFLRYQPLYKFILNTLAEECRNDSSLVLQPILMILSRLYPCSLEEELCQADEYLPYINACLANPVYQTREAAAKASVPLISSEAVKDHFEKCFTKISNPHIGDNECHGILLQVYLIITTNPVSGLPLRNYVKQSCHIFELAGKKFSHMTVNLYTELLTFLMYIAEDFDDVPSLKTILSHLSKQARQNEVPLTWQENFIASRVLAYFIIIQKFEETAITYSTITTEIMTYLYGTQNNIKTFFLELLTALNQMQVYYNQSDQSMGGTDCPLFYTGDVDLLVPVTNLVTNLSRTSIEKILRHIHPHAKQFLIEELKIQQYIRTEDRVLLFLLLDFYPCAIKCLRLSKQETLNALLSYCDCDNEELISAVISCISTFLEEVDYTLLKYDKLLQILAKSASPVVAVHRRLTVCNFLCKNSYLYCSDKPILKGDELCAALNIVMILLEDEDLDVRNSMSNYEDALQFGLKIDQNKTLSGSKVPVVPEKAKEDLINLMTLLLPQEKAVCLIFSWACRYFPDPSSEPAELFERGGLNPYAENTPLIDICSRVLIKMLWTLPQGLSYDDRSIFPEEQTQIVTTVLLDSLTKYDSPMMLTKTKMSVICVLRSINNFLDNAEISSGFIGTFRPYLNDTLIGYLTNHLEHGDMYCVKKIIRKLYDPVLRLRR